MAAPKTKSKKTKKDSGIVRYTDFSGKPLSKESVREILHEMKKDIGAEIMLADGGELDVEIRGVISTQCATLDRATGRNGIPLGRLTILHGPEGCGKTTLALHIASEVQKVGGLAAFFDKEYKLDLEYAAKLGVDRERLFLVQPNTLEDVFKYTEAIIKLARKMREKTGVRVPVVIVLDSMNAAITKAQFDGEWDDKHMAPQARCFSQNLPKLMPLIYKEDVALVWISQIRQKMNALFGNDEEIAGGKGPRFYASMIISIKRIGSVKKGEETIGNRTVALVQKNQVAPPFRKAEFVIKYGHGIDNERSILELGSAAEVVEKSGAWYHYKGERLGQGLDNASDFLRKRPETCEMIWKEIQEAM